VTYRIRPLVWRDKKNGMESEAESYLGKFSVDPLNSKWFWSWSCSDEGATSQCDSLADGKQKAEDWYRSQILPALEEVGDDGDDSYV